jgi:hypothetical protein
MQMTPQVLNTEVMYSLISLSERVTPAHNEPSVPQAGTLWASKGQKGHPSASAQGVCSRLRPLAAQEHFADSGRGTI